MKERFGLIAGAVYERLMDQYSDDSILPDVAPIFVPGHPCYEEYARMYDACSRIRQKLGDDHDLEIVIDALLRHGKILALEMFCYGAVYGMDDAFEACSEVSLVDGRTDQHTSS